MISSNLLALITLRRHQFQSSTLIMNAFYLMLSTFVVAASGFGFWILIAHTYATTAVGLATTLLSVSGLLSLLGLAGFDTTFVRFLPRSARKNEYINSGLIITALLSAVFSIGLGLVLPVISPSLSALHSPWALAAFVFFTVITALNVLTNAVFLAFKQARYIFVINSVFSLFKVLAPLAVAHGSAMTIFGLAGSAQLVGLVLSIIWMHRAFNYKFSLALDVEALRVVRKFSSSVYISSILNLLPPTLLPLIIIYHLGPKNAAYYYMAFTIASVLYTVAYASMQSVFAEGSHNEAAIGRHVTKAAKLITVLLLPSIVIVGIASNTILAAFGSEYAHSASGLLRLFALSALPVASYSALGAIFKVTKNLQAIVSMNVTYATVILGLSYWLVAREGIVGVGWAWLIGNMVACVVGFVFINKRSRIKGYSNGTTS